MDSLISVIVPIYNVEAYLDRCVKSIITQTYKNLEIILVDDGSTDSSGKMCDSYASMDHRVKVIHKANGGQSSARNAGLNVCKGDYIGFVDSDDWIEPEMYSALLAALQEHDAELAIAGRYDVYENTELKTIGKCPVKNGVYETKQILPLLIIGNTCDSSVCDKLFHKNLWLGFRFPEGELYEDLAVMYKIVIKARHIVMCNRVFYNYFHRKGSTVTAGFRKSLADYPKQAKHLVEDIEEQYPEFTNHAIWSYIKSMQFVLIELLRTDRKTFLSQRKLYDTYLQEIKKYRKIWRKDSLFSNMDRLICEILLRKNLSRLIFNIKR